MSATHKLPELFPGHRYWKSMQGSVDAILTPMGIKRRVVSRGVQFVNYDAWTGEAFAQHLCNWFSRRPKRVPAGQELVGVIHKANKTQCSDPHIRVARMPHRVTHRTALAIVGGGYHEAWHTKYSKRDKVRIEEVQPLLDVAEQVILGGGEFDAKLRGLLLTLHHLIEDIRIERRGNEDFPGTEQPMRDLQDFILDLEFQARGDGAKVKNVTVSTNARSIMLCCFRDLGLGYSTQKSRAMLQFYKATAPDAIQLLAPGGILAPFLHEAKNLSREDGIGSLRVAMKIVVELWRATQSEEAEEEKPEMVCPQCGAGPKQLIIRSVKNEQGVKIKGRAELECKACGFKDEFDLPDNSLNLDQQQDEQDEPEEKPEIEDLDQDDVGNGADGFGDDSRQHMRDELDEDSEDEGSEDEGSEDEGSEDTEDGDTEDGDTEDSEDRDSEDEDSEDRDSEDRDSEDRDSEDRDSEDEDSEGDEIAGSPMEVEGIESDEDEDESSANGGSDGSDEGGNEKADGEDGDEKADGDEECDKERDGDKDKDWEMSGEDFQNLGGTHDLGQDPDSALFGSQEILDGDENDGLMTHQTALTEALEGLEEVEQKDVKGDERLWNPVDLSRDEARVVHSNHKEFDTKKANEMLAEVRPAVTYLRARLRTILKAQEMTDVTHGVRRGRRMSQRTFVDTVVDLESGCMPTRAYQVRGAQLDTSFAVAVCLDQSSSMQDVGVTKVAQTMMVMVDSIDSVGGKTMAFGFRDGASNPDYDIYTHGVENFHRVHGIRYDIFKTWEENFANVKWRFAHTHADGWTPMADGVQYGLAALNERREAHRILTVITDGNPTPPHDQVIQRQLRLAKAAGVHVIGIGIGKEAHYVQTLFPDYVWAASIDEMPQPLLKKLNELCDFTGRFRGRRVRLDSVAKRAP